MRIVTWNCSRGSYFKKVARIDSLLWNVAVVQECATPPLESEHSLWFGDEVNQGIAVLSRPPYRLTRLPQVADVPKFVIPVAVSAPGIGFVLFAVWSKKNKPYPYVQGVVKAVSMYRSVFDAGPCVIVGDFNSNTIWDKTHPSIANHSALVRCLAEWGLTSAYHDHFDEAHGQETRPTYHHQKSRQVPHHIDYCFMPRAWLGGVRSVEVGLVDEWLADSDHCPLVVDVDVGRTEELDTVELEQAAAPG
jgi:exodeoxyribonuclease III